MLTELRSLLEALGGESSSLSFAACRDWLHSLTPCLVYKVSSGKLSLFNITLLWPGLFYLPLPHCRTLWPTKVIQDNLSILNSIKFISNFNSNCKINPHLPCQYMCSLRPRFICSNSTPQCDVVRRGDVWEVIISWGWRPHAWDSCPYKGEHKELPFPFTHVRTQWGDGHLWTKNYALTRPWICQGLDLGFPRLQNCEIHFSCFWATQFMVMCYSSLNRVRCHVTLHIYRFQRLECGSL